MTNRKSCDGGYERGVGKKYKEETRNPHGNPKEEEGKGICQAQLQSLQEAESSTSHNDKNNWHHEKDQSDTIWP